MRGGITRHLIQNFRYWERRAQIAFVVGMLLLGIVIVVGALLPPEPRQYAFISMIGVLIAVQLVFLWANRGMVRPFTRAQRYYLAEDFEAARDTLVAAQTEAETSGRTLDPRSLTLLGNTYRQLGDVDNSLRVLQIATELEQNAYFPLYGFGRTLLVAGRYADAAEAIAQALGVGAPPSVRSDLAEAWYRAGDADAARSVLAEIGEDGEAYRQLMVTYLRHRLDNAPPPDTDLLKAGLPFWEASAARFSHTPYGAALQDDVNTMAKFTNER